MNGCVSLEVLMSRKATVTDEALERLMGWRHDVGERNRHGARSSGPCLATIHASSHGSSRGVKVMRTCMIVARGTQVVESQEVKTIMLLSNLTIA